MSELQAILKRLVDKGLLEMTGDGTFVSLTEAGRDTVEDELYGELRDAVIEGEMI